MRFQTVVGGVICQTAHPLNAGFGETHKIMTVPVRSGPLKGAEFLPFELSTFSSSAKRRRQNRHDRLGKRRRVFLRQVVARYR
jgi:hypothetical protein